MVPSPWAMLHRVGMSRVVAVSAGFVCPRSPGLHSCWPCSCRAAYNPFSEAFGDKFGQGVQGLFGFLISVILSFFLGWQLSLIVLAVVPVMTAGMIVFGNAMQEVAMETQSWYAQAAAVVEETLFAVRTVVAFGGERKALAKYEAAVKKAQAGAPACGREHRGGESRLRR